MANISIKNIAEAIYESGKDKSGIDLANTMKNATKILADKHLLGKTPQILEKLEQIIDSKESIVRAKITSVNILSKKDAEEIEELIKKRYRAKEVEMNFREDKELLGGIKIEVGDEVINMTLRNRLNKLQDYLIKN
jgi:F-type H+-transporting ATPase subunit delta